MNWSRRLALRNALRAEARHNSWQGLLAVHGTPLLVLDPDRVATRYRMLAKQLRGFRLHYAVKALPHPAVLMTVAAWGGGFDVATNAEVDLLRTMRMPMDRCVHTHPVKKPADIEHAYRAGVRTFVVDNPVEAQKFTSMPADIEVLVRLGFPNPTAKSDLSTKFGVSPREADLIVKHVIAAGVRFAGFSFHVGSQSACVEPYRTALRETLQLIDHVEHTLDVRARVIDIGGGFPVDYRESMPGIESVGAIVDEVLGERRRDFALMAEPGRFLVADSMTLLSSVVGSALRDGRTWHYLDDGVYGSYSNVLTEDVHPPILSLREVLDDGPDEHSFESVTLAGPTCDSADVVAHDYPMPPLSVGDIIVSPMMGAYTSVTASGFNGIAATPIALA